MGAAIDDRNFRSCNNDIEDVHLAVDDFDSMAGQTIEHEKTAIAIVGTETMKAVRKHGLGGRRPDILPHFVLVGDVMNTQVKKICKYSDKRVREAISVVARIISFRSRRAWQCMQFRLQPYQGWLMSLSGPFLARVKQGTSK